MKICLSLLLLSTLFTSVVQSRVLQEDAVAQVIVLRGEVKGLDPDGVVFEVQKDMWLAEGTVLQSAERSMARLLFIDRSTMNLGPESQMKIDEFPRDKAGIITLMKGQVRSNVTKDYMNMDSEEQSKLFIKTKTAAMGVRGTDFQVNFNPNNENTALITFSGAVAMAQLDPSFDRQGFSQTRLENVVSSDRAVMVREGEFSGVTSSTSRATIPTRISPVQFESLKNNDTGISPGTSQKEGSGASDRAQYRNPLPPGVDSKSFANDPRQSAARAVGAAVGGMETASVATQSASTNNTTGASRAPEGFFNAATGEYAPPAGSVVDLATVNIIPPPAGSAFDPISQTFTLPPEFGGINPTTGSYEAPQGFVLTDSGQFAVTVDSQTGRTPASSDGSTSTDTAKTLNTSIASPTNTDSVTLLTNADTMNTVIVGAELTSLVEETQLEVEQQIQETREQEMIIQNTTTNATFRFTVTD